MGGVDEASLDKVQLAKGSALVNYDRGELDAFLEVVPMDVQRGSPKDKSCLDEEIEVTADEMVKHDNQLIALTEPGDEEVKLKDFKIKRVLDQGTFGKVFLVVNVNTGREYAMKRINKDVLIEKAQIQNTKTEKEILLQSKSPFIISMDYVFQNDLRLYFILEYVNGGNLLDHLRLKRRLPEE